MKRVHVYFDPADAPQTLFDRAIEVLLCGLLLFCPATFGGVHAWAEEVVIAIAVAITLLLAIKLMLRPDARFVTTWTYLPIALFLGLVAFQLLPLPTSAMRVLSAATARTKTDLLSDLPNAASVLAKMSLTFNADATLRQLRLLLAVVFVFVAVVNVYQRIEQIRRLLVTIALIGSATAILAIAQSVTHASRIYWLIPTTSGVASSGTFENHSHFCQFMNLSIGAMLALLLLQWYTFFRNGELGELDWRQKLLSPEFRTLWLLIAALVLAATSILLSLSRGGVISMIVAALVTVPLIATKAHVKGAGWTFVLLVLAISGVLFYFGSEAVFARLGSITYARSQGSRLEMLRDLTHAWRQYPIFGTGLGSYRYVYPFFDTSGISAVAAHAENEYAQTMTETGAIGLAVAMWFLAIVAASFTRAIRGRRSASGAIAIGLGYGLIAILLHSTSDFGQHIPANAMLTAISCALIVSVARLRDRELGLESAPPEFRGSRPPRIGAGLIVAGVGAVMIFAADRARVGESAYRAARADEQQFRQRGWLGSIDEYRDLITAARRATTVQPRNVDYRYWQDVYIRFYATSPLRAPYMIGDATRLVDDLNAARQLAPSFGPLFSELGYVERFILNRPEGAVHIRKGFELEPSDPRACLDVAQLEAVDGNWPDAVKHFRRCIQLAPGMDTEILPFVAIEMNRPADALAIADGNAVPLRRLQELLKDRPADTAIAADARARETALNRAAAEQKDCDAFTLVLSARSYASEGDYSKAIEQFHLAIAQDYRQPGWHFELAQSLARANKPADAIRELRICLNQQPNLGEAEALLKELTKPR